MLYENGRFIVIKGVYIFMIVNQIGTSGSSSDNAEIGDIKITARTDLGDKWLLCNGAEVSAQDYSELAELLPLLSRAWATKDL